MMRILWPLLLIFSFLGSPSARADDQNGVASLRQTAKAFAQVAKAVSPSVVNIQVEGESPISSRSTLPANPLSPFSDEFFRRFFGERRPSLPHSEQPQSKRQTLGQGSGFVFAAEGGQPPGKTYVLTNNHVVEKAAKIRVRLEDGREFEARIAGADPQSDVAVIELPIGGIPAVKLADSSRLEVGEWVLAIGNPFGLSHTVTVGVVSAKERTSLGINDYEDFIQTDAAINPGNSGGPLVNLDGEVVGMNTAIFSRSGGYMGVGFAIPSSLLGAVANQLIEGGAVTRGFLGIVIQQLTPELAHSFGLEANKGILIAQVAEDSPAQQAGLRQADVILEQAGAPVGDIGAFRNRIALTPPGTQVPLTVLRDGRRLEIRVVVGTLSEEVTAIGQPTQEVSILGLSVQTLTPQLADQFDARPGEGVVVTGVESNSLAALAGIEPGAILLQVNRQPIQDAAGFRRAIDQSGDRRALLLVRQKGMQRFVALAW